jgi:small subunit ribosomal protein S16
VAVKIKLKRLGKIRAPYYRIVVADARTKRDGRAIEEIGKYHPKTDPSFIEVNSERAQHWLSVGAQPTDPVRKLLEITGDWQKFKGLPGAEGTLRTAEPKPDKKIAFAVALQETLDEGGSATTAKGKTRAKAGDTAAKTTKAKAEKSDKADSAAKPEADKPEKAEKSDNAAKADAAKADAAKLDAAKPDAAKADNAKPDADNAAKAEKSAKPAKDDAPAAEAADTAASAEATAPAATEPAAAEAAGDSASSEG